jgi:glycosyltransferase involved in cell wall biosynthesis
MPQRTGSPSRIWVVSELYYPEDTSTGYYLTRIAAGLAARSTDCVHVLCGRPSYAFRGQQVPKTETHEGVHIRRCFGTTWNKDRLLLRLVNLLTLSLSMFFQAAWRMRRGDRVLVVTNPPLLPFVISWACRLRGARCVLLIHDVYPDVAIAAGLLKPTSLVAKGMNFAVKRLYRSVERIIALGRDMRELVQRKLPPGDDRIEIIPNWADTELVTPRSGENRILHELGLTGKFVVNYAGNMGRSHNLEAIVECADALRNREDIHFLLSGSGAKKDWLVRAISEMKLSNVTIADRRPRGDLPELLTAGDVALIPFVFGMAGVSVPSRLYNMLAAGMPILALADPQSEVGLVVNEEVVGVVIPPENIPAFQQAILGMVLHPKIRQDMGQRARQAAESKYQFSRVIEQYCQVMDVSPRQTESASHHVSAKFCA